MFSGYMLIWCYGLSLDCDFMNFPIHDVPGYWPVELQVEVLYLFLVLSDFLDEKFSPNWS